MATNQGNARTATHKIPAAGRSLQTQRAERSSAISASADNITSMRINGPFNSTPPAIAVQKIAGIFHPETSAAPGRCWER